MEIFNKVGNKKNLYIGGSIIAVILIAVIVFVIVNLNSAKASDAMEAYVKLINNEKYNEMYEMLSSDAKNNISLEEFVNRNKNIYTGIEADKIKVSDIEESDGQVSYTMSMNSIAGEFSFTNTVDMVKEDGDYKLNWNDSVIFPDLQSDGFVSVKVDSGLRGSIIDRNDVVLATQADLMQVGFVPGKIEDRDAALASFAQLAGISVESIEDKLNASWVEDDLFVPIKNIAYDSAKYDQFMSVSGVQISILNDAGRSYPYAEKCAHITGYVQSITAEELEKHKDEGYTSDSLIGKTGIESIYEEKLRAQDGYSIVVLDANRNEIKSMARKEKQDGETVKLTIDINVQTYLFDKLANDAGSVSAMDPHTGEVLALVSTPSYDPNEFAYGISNARWEEITNNDLNPLQARFTNAFAPGSTFKAITGAIGLENEIITNDTDLGKAENWLWQLDESWGDYFVPTTAQYSEPSNLVNALKYSDNIYFAKLATEIGDDDYADGLDDFGFNETLPFDFGLSKSTYGKKLDDSITLATTGFGQGQLQVNPIHLTTMYSAFINDGNMLQPYLLYDEGKASYYKENVVSSETAVTLKNALIETANRNAPVEGQTIGGKTGTAEVGEEQIGWMVAFREDGNRPLLVTVMVENAKAMNGSVYVIPIIQDIFTNIQ